MSVIQYAVEVLKVKHIIVVGHYGCGGVISSMRQKSLGGVIDVWLRALKDIYENHREALEVKLCC
jgi:carbonic anhydrase